MNPAELFVHAAWLPIVLLALVVDVLLRIGDAVRRARLARVLGARAVELTADAGAGQRRARRTLFSLGTLCALLAALQPTFGEEPRAGERRGVDVVVCLDVSRSMLATDLAPDRLAAAQQGIRALAERTRGDRLALVVFAGEAKLAVPLTHDVTTFGELVAAASPSSVVRGGTDLGAALRTAGEALAVGEREHAVVVLITDGEDHAGNGRRAAAELFAQKTVVHCVGFGTARGSKIALEGQGFLRTRDGQDVVSALDETALRAVAEAGGGTYVSAEHAGPLALVDLFVGHIVPRSRTVFEAGTAQERAQRFQVPLGAAFAAYLASLALTGRAFRRRSRPARGGADATARGAV